MTNIPQELLDAIAHITLADLPRLLEALRFERRTPPGGAPSAWRRTLASRDTAARWRVFVVDVGDELRLAVLDDSGATYHGDDVPVELWNTRYEREADAEGLRLEQARDVVEVIGALVRAAR